jgi:anti-anti-sigma regulatory factor
MVERASRNGSALFVVIREESRSTDLRFLGEFSDATARRLPEALRQIMRRSPALLHFDLREIDVVDDEGIRRLAHAVRICRRHGAMVKVSASTGVEEAAEALGATAALGMIPRALREPMTATDGHMEDGRAGARPRY